MSVKEASAAAATVGVVGGAGLAYHYGLGSSGSASTKWEVSGLNLDCNQGISSRLTKLFEDPKPTNSQPKIEGTDWEQAQVTPEKICWSLNVTKDGEKVKKADLSMVATSDSKNNGVIIYSRLDGTKNSLVPRGLVYVDKDNSTWKVTGGFEFTTDLSDWFDSGKTEDIKIKFNGTEIKDSEVHEWKPDTSKGTDLDVFKVEFTRGSDSKKPLFLGQGFQSSKVKISRVLGKDDLMWKEAKNDVILSKDPLIKATGGTSKGTWEKKSN